VEEEAVGLAEDVQELVMVAAADGDLDMPAKVVAAADVADAEARAVALVGIEAVAVVWVADAVEAVADLAVAPRRKSSEASTAYVKHDLLRLHPQQKSCCSVPFGMHSLQQAPNQRCQSQQPRLSSQSEEFYQSICNQST